MHLEWTTEEIHRLEAIRIISDQDYSVFSTGADYRRVWELIRARRLRDT